MYLIIMQSTKNGRIRYVGNGSDTLRKNPARCVPFPSKRSTRRAAHTYRTSGRFTNVEVIPMNAQI